MTVNASMVALPELEDAACSVVASSRFASLSIVACGEPCRKPFLDGVVE